MATKTSVTQTSTGLSFSMELVYYPATAKYAVVFASQSLYSDTTEVKQFDSFGAAWDCYDKNFFYYRGVHPAKITEEEFQGVPMGTLYPAKEAC